MAQASSPVNRSSPPSSAPPSPVPSDGSDEGRIAAAAVLAMPYLPVQQEDQPRGLVQTALEVADPEAGVALNVIPATSWQRVDARNSLFWRITTGAFLALSAVSLGAGYGNDIDGLKVMGWICLSCSALAQCARRYC